MIRVYFSSEQSDPHGSLRIDDSHDSMRIEVSNSIRGHRRKRGMRRRAEGSKYPIFSL